MTTQPAPSSRLQRPIIAVVVQQHAEEAAQLRHVRSVLVRAPHVNLLRLGRLDERLAAHLDGLAVAGPAGKALCRAALERPGAGEIFALAVVALEARDQAPLDDLLALWPVVADARRGLVSAYGWVSASVLKGVVRELLSAPPGPALELGIEACRLHQVNPGAVLNAALASPLSTLRAVAARAAGELGRVDLLPALLRGQADEPDDVAFWKARSACLLGDRQQALVAAAAIAVRDGPWSDRALAVVMAASATGPAREWAQRLSQAARGPGAGIGEQRRLIRTLAWLGDLRFVPWLIARMSEPPLARLAGEAFHWITGADLALLDLETLEAPSAPALLDDADADGSIDEDDSLPWPDPARVQAWWAREQSALEAVAMGDRLFLGRALSAQTARHVLTEGTQRQRAHAAMLASLLQPGRPVFQVAAPVARQKRALAEWAA
ncbi:MAG: TIGR02270 family protein [Betaproteobacteria bacterium]|nr:TIGR02270 family protein [Betaproteobacteria bacterium]